jgi:hypothetical protein
VLGLKFWQYLALIGLMLLVSGRPWRWLGSAPQSGPDLDANGDDQRAGAQHRFGMAAGMAERRKAQTARWSIRLRNSTVAYTAIAAGSRAGRAVASDFRAWIGGDQRHCGISELP